MSPRGNQLHHVELHEKVSTLKREHLAQVEHFAARQYSASLVKLQLDPHPIPIVSTRPVQLQVSLRHGWSTLRTNVASIGVSNELA